MEEPAEIKKLDEAVINRIAAGEVIQRPSNALKEMIENSIDAKSNNIQIVVKEGGLKLMQITDNGVGIRKEDFSIVCERFTTSKLQKFEDLNSINTYGFRGEALASISHVAHLTIQSKTQGQDCAYKASYTDSLLKDKPKPCAGNQGTIITVEDLFYNMSTRKKALKNATEEFRQISDMLGKYAIHNSTLSFSLKKYGDNVSIKTPGKSTQIDNIRIIYGNEIAKELISFECSNDELKFSANGLITNVNYSTKKGTLILFINDRLVENTAIKKSIDHIFSTYLPKNCYPFVYLSLKIDPKNIDVNVHPTKYEVQFMHDDQIIEQITCAMDSKLLKSNNSRVFYTQAKLPGAEAFKTKHEDSKYSIKNVYDKNLVRTNHTDQKLDKFLIPEITDKSKDVINKSILNLTTPSSSQDCSNWKETNLTSILQLRKDIEEKCHVALRELVMEHVFVGCIDVNRALIQHNTKLYMCNTKKLIQELFYQLILYHFQNFKTIEFTKPVPLKELVLIALELPDVGWTEEEGDKNELADTAVQILRNKAALLSDYFSFKIDSDNNLIGIPQLLEKHIPEWSALPRYILRLATDVNWKNEKECFQTFAKETADFYAANKEASIGIHENCQWTIEHVLYPAIKKFLLPPNDCAKNSSILQLADLPNLYKVFERC